MKENSVLNYIMIWIMIIVSFLLFYLLYIWDFIFVPLVVSFFLFILFRWVYSFFQKYIKIKPISIILTLWTFFSFFVIVWFIITTQVWSFVDNSGKIIQWFSKLLVSIEWIWDNFWIDLKDYLNLEYLRWLLTKINFSAIWKNVYSFTTWAISLFLTILVLLFFMILERNDFKKKIKYNFDSKITRKIQNIYEKVSSDLNLYFSTKFFLALFNGVVATIIMSFFWLDFALTFWLIVFVMDFIPIVWALIALWLPFLYSLVVFDSIWSSFLMLFSMYVPQIVTGNFVEPKIMWDRLNISYIVFVLALLFWTQFWWIIWAFLATPIMVTINIILSKFEATKFISVLLSKDWWK